MNMEGGREEGWSSMRQDKTMINTLMLRFRPIAPKPAVGRPLLGPSPAFKDNKAMVSARRTKRKYVRVGRNSKGTDDRTVAKQGVRSGSATTLQLLEENHRGEQKVSSCSMYSKSVTVMDNNNEDEDDASSNKPFIRLNLNLNLNLMNGPIKEALGDMEGMGGRRKRVETLVTVEDVSETCMDDGLGLGCTDTEKLAYLGGDTCPGFVSDSSNRVVWVNGAFRGMVMSFNNNSIGEEEEEVCEMEVRLVMKEELGYSAFTCRVKVQYRWWNWKERFSQMVPCDAWRMDGGGFAWRLDVKAALRLGL